MRALLCLFIIAAIRATGQPSLQHIEDYSLGETERYMKCTTAGVSAGATGALHTWTFDHLTAKNDTLKMEIVSPSTTPYSQFSSASFVQKYSDGRYIFMDKTPTANFLIGYVSTTHNIVIPYQNTSLTMLRPCTYSTQGTDTFFASYVYGVDTYYSVGYNTITCDGYGTLILPGGTYTDVLRIKTIVHQQDSTPSFSGIYDVYTASYLWYDDQHKAPLLRIDSVISGTHLDISVVYLLQQTTGIKNTDTDVFAQAGVYFSGSDLVISGLSDNNIFYTIDITGMTGRTIYSVKANSVNGSYRASIDKFLQPGFYLVRLRSAKGSARVFKCLKY